MHDPDRPVPDPREASTKGLSCSPNEDGNEIESLSDGAIEIENEVNESQIENETESELVEPELKSGTAL
ncbi:hypothetical protein EVAR_82955_1 [Eumeta japonica]|uniref:Uncharacterized protein n=1 Tax=Eumeta variegata TaxID=151549 RepID=A0A4C1VT61_EUMVA|nr:hypothetical protein EVAR_82955_1 [Eumeta japonica]